MLHRLREGAGGKEELRYGDIVYKVGASRLPYPDLLAREDGVGAYWVGDSVRRKTLFLMCGGSMWWNGLV